MTTLTSPSNTLVMTVSFFLFLSRRALNNVIARECKGHSRPRSLWHSVLGHSQGQQPRAGEFRVFKAMAKCATANSHDWGFTQIAVKQVLLKRGNDLVTIRDEVRMHKYWAHPHIVKLLGFQNMKKGDADIGVEMLMEYVRGAFELRFAFPLVRLAQAWYYRCLVAHSKRYWTTCGKVASRTKASCEITRGRSWTYAKRAKLC